MDGIGLLYADDAYVERLAADPGTRPAGGAQGLMGRQVAGRAFLDALLTHGRWDRLVAVVRDARSGATLKRFCQEHPSSRGRARRLRVVPERRFLEDFLPAPPVGVLHHPSPPDPRHAWARQHGGPHGVALCGVTHTLASAGAVGMLGSLLTAPFEPYDALVCTSRAVEAMVRAVVGAQAEFLRSRHGGAPALGVRLERIPLGVDPDAFRPATPDQRAAARAALGIAPDEVVVLFVGRLAHHAKAHPYPLYRAAARAASRPGGPPVHLVLAGWAPNEPIRAAFQDGADRFAGGARVSLVDGTDPAIRRAVWHAADVFASPSDNLQETFGLVVVEAMASGLPVVASDWDGYRDLVVPGGTGLLAPTALVAGSLSDATARLLLGATSYDHFLAECSQATAVDVEAFAEGVARLVADADLRRRLGAAGRARAESTFAWRHVILAYEALWASQDAERRARLAAAGRAPAGAGRGPSCYPEPLVSFAGYPTRRLDAADPVVAAPAAEAELPALLAAPLTSHAADRRVTDAAVLVALLARAAVPRPLADLDGVLARAGASPRAARATIAWLLKYGLLRPA
jgi:glycosyltransferase involved in cell wall biosynthesis